MAQDQRTSPSDATHIYVEEEETNVTHEGMWPSSSVSQDCCIYRVPNQLRRVNPDAYTPRMLLIGPLHHSKKADAAQFAEQGFFPDNNGETKSRYLGYLNMEQQKKIYLAAFRKRAGEYTVEHFRRTIQEDEEKIRQSYAESTDWIQSPEFVDMILHDSVFILEYFLSFLDELQPREMPRRLTIACSPVLSELFEDLILLENQLPYFLLEKLFEPVINTLHPDLTFRQIISLFFSPCQGDAKKIKETTKFRHFTDLLRSFRVETLDLTQEKADKDATIKHLDTADKLRIRGVEFEAEKDRHSLEVKFNKGCFRMPCMTVHDQTEMVLRNIMALEQCHYPLRTYVCSYVMFLDFLIDTDKDVDLLVQKGVIQNWIGHQESVAAMVNKLCLGVTDETSLYYDTAERLMNYRPNPIKKSLVTLRRVYFADLWKGTATVAAIALLFMTLVQTVTSIIQVLQN